MFLNVGSVGKPKDGDWRACYIALEPGASNPVEFFRLRILQHPDDHGRDPGDRPTHEFADDLEHAGAPAK